MKNELSGLLNILRNYLFFLILFLGTRVFFLFYFGSTELIEGRSDEILYALFLGARYDIIVLSYLFLPLFLFWLLLNFISRKMIYNLFIFFNQVWFIFSGIVIISIVVADLAFYSFFWRDSFDFIQEWRHSLVV